MSLTEVWQGAELSYHWEEPECLLRVLILQQAWHDALECRPLLLQKSESVFCKSLHYQPWAAVCQMDTTFRPFNVFTGNGTKPLILMGKVHWMIMEVETLAFKSFQKSNLLFFNSISIAHLLQNWAIEISILHLLRHSSFHTLKIHLYTLVPLVLSDVLSLQISALRVHIIHWGSNMSPLRGFCRYFLSDNLFCHIS